MDAAMALANCGSAQLLTSFQSLVGRELRKQVGNVMIFFLGKQVLTRKKVRNIKISPKPSKEEFSEIILYGVVDFFQNY